MVMRILAIVIAVLIFWQPMVIAQEVRSFTRTINGQEVTVPDWENITFGSLPPVMSAGEIRVTAKEVSGIKVKKKYARRAEQVFNYNPSRAWSTGTPVSGIFKLGDFEAFGLPEQSLEQIAASGGTSLENKSLKDFGPFSEQSLKSLAIAVPEILDQPVSAIPVIRDFVANVTENPIAQDLMSQADRQVLARFAEQHPELVNLPIEAILDGDVDSVINYGEKIALERLEKINPDLAGIPIGAIARGDWKQAGKELLNSGVKVVIGNILKDNPILGETPFKVAGLDLGKYDLKSVPGITNVSVGLFKNSGNATLNQIPGAANLPLSNLLSMKDLLKIQFAKVDLALGDLESKAPEALSGSTKNDKYKPVPCVAGKDGVKNCPHIELADNITLPGLSVKGRQWVRGKSQSVEGGKGVLGVINGGKEPTGLVPWGPGPNMKLVIGDIDEAQGKAELQIYFRVCVKKLFVDLGCTPYFIGPIPFGSVSEKGLVLVASTGPAPQVNIPPDIARQIAEIEGQYSSPDVGDCGDLPSKRKQKHGHYEYQEVSQEKLISVGSYRGIRTEYMEQNAGQAYLKMTQAAAAQGIGLVPISGFRSVEDQTGLWNNQIGRRGSESEAAKYSAPPRHSEHHTGLAIDIGDRDYVNTDTAVAFEGTPAGQWLRKNAAQFGFKMSFPKGNSQGVSYEPWHWRFEGNVASRQIFNPQSGGSGNSKNNLDIYLKRIRIGESSDGQDFGPNAQTGAYGYYQFTRSTRGLLMARYPQHDPWSKDRKVADQAAINWIKLYGDEKRIDIIALIKAGKFAEADRILGRAQFTSLPGGAEESAKWKNKTLLASVSPGGSGSYGSGACTFTATPCEPGKPCKFFNPNPKGFIPSYKNVFGAPRKGYSHQGVDLQSPAAVRNNHGPGDPIYAIADGKVSEYVKVGGRCGGVISILHPQHGIESRYLHMIKLTVPEGASVKRGQQIGVEGDELSDVCSFGAHLHFEIYKNGVPINPVYFDYEPPMPRSPRA